MSHSDAPIRAWGNFGSLRALGWSVAVQLAAFALSWVLIKYGIAPEMPGMGMKDRSGVPMAVLEFAYIRCILALPLVLALVALPSHRARWAGYLIWCDGIAGAVLLVGLPVAFHRQELGPCAVALAAFAGLTGFGIFFVGLRLVRGLMLHSELRRRGYLWLTYGQAEVLWSLCGVSAFRLPPWEHLAVLPGVSRRNIKSLAKLVRALETSRGGL